MSANGEDNARYEVLDPEIKLIMNAIGSAIDEVLPDEWGFTILLFNFEDDETLRALFYLSNAEREGMIKALEEFIERNKK